MISRKNWKAEKLLNFRTVEGKLLQNKDHLKCEI